MASRVDVPVVIVGAGLAGLVTAVELARRGIQCCVLEQSHRLGGRVHTVTFDDGVTAEAHMEEFWEFSPAYELLHELGLPLDEDIAHSSLVIDGELRVCEGAGARDPYLQGMFSLAEQADFLRWNATASAVMSTIDSLAGASSTASALPAELAKVSFADFVRSNTDTHKVAEWVRIVVESETAIEWHRICALDGVAEMRQFLDTPECFGQRNAHVQGGNQQFVDALAALLPAGTIQFGAAVLAASDRGSHVRVTARGDTGRATTRSCEQLVLTVPAWSLGRIDLDLRLSAPARHALATQASGSYVKVLLRLRSEAARQWADLGPGLFTLLSDSPAGCLYLTGDGGADDDLVLTSLVHGYHARRLSGLTDREIGRRLIRDLEGLEVSLGEGKARRRIFGNLMSKVSDIRAFDYPQAVAYWPIAASRSRFDDAAVALRTAQGRVYLGGDTTECSHSDGAIRSAQRIAVAVAERLGVPEGMAV